MKYIAIMMIFEFDKYFYLKIKKLSFLVKI